MKTILTALTLHNVSDWKNIKNYVHNEFTFINLSIGAGNLNYEVKSHVMSIFRLQIIPDLHVYKLCT